MADKNYFGGWGDWPEKRYINVTIVIIINYLHHLFHPKQTKKRIQTQFGYHLTFISFIKKDLLIKSNVAKRESVALIFRHIVGY